MARFGRLGYGLRAGRKRAGIELPDTLATRWMQQLGGLVLIALLPVGMIPFLMAAQAVSFAAEVAMMLAALAVMVLLLWRWWNKRPRAEGAGAKAPPRGT